MDVPVPFFFMGEPSDARIEVSQDSPISASQYFEFVESKSKPTRIRLGEKNRKDLGHLPFNNSVSRTFETMH